jgi:hypothetical protein
MAISRHRDPETFEQILGKMAVSLSKKMLLLLQDFECIPVSRSRNLPLLYKTVWYGGDADTPKVER